MGEPTHLAARDISVVVPVHNHAAYVGDAILSVLRQTLPPRRLIIIDDGSSDGSAAAVEACLAGCAVPPGCEVTLRVRENRGAAATLNEGLACADTRYVAILNSDDLFEAGRLEACRRAAEEARAGFVVTYVEPIDRDGRPLPLDHPWRRWYADARLHELDVLPTLGFTLLFGNVAVSTGTFFVRRDHADAIGPFRDFRYAHDLDYLLRACALEEPLILREPLYRYRLHGANTILVAQEAVDAECARIYADFFVATARGAANPLAPTLDRFASTLSGWPLPAALARGLDSLVESAPEPPGDGPATEPRIAGSRVTLIGHEFSRTGAPVVMLEIARALAARGRRPTLIAAQDGPLQGEIRAAGLSAVVPGSRLRRWSARLARAARPDLVGGFLAGLAARGSRGLEALATLSLRRHRPPVQAPALVNSSSSAALAAALLRRHQGRVVWYIHETLDPRLILRREDDRAGFVEIAQRPETRLVFGSEATRRAWAAQGFDGVVRYWSGLERRAPSSKEPAGLSRRTILSVGTSGPRKGTGDLIEVFAAALRSGVVPEDVDLCIVGCRPPSQTPHTRDLLRRIWRADLHGRVRLVGAVPPAALDAYYERAVLYVQASTMECLPLALLSAMSHGLPIVTTDAGGCAEAVIDGQSGLVVPARSPARLLEAVLRLLRDPAEAARFGEAARARFDTVFAREVTEGSLLALLLDDWRG